MAHVQADSHVQTSDTSRFGGGSEQGQIYGMERGSLYVEYSGLFYILGGF
jgi:hypothetical protein